MAKDRRKLQHIHSSIADKQPTPQTLEVGEIAVNNADKKEFLSIKSSDDKVVRFSSDEQMITWMEKKEVVPYVGQVRGDTYDATTADTHGSVGITNDDLLQNKSNIVVKMNQVAAANTPKYDKINGAKDIYGHYVNLDVDGTVQGAGFSIDMSRYAMIGANPTFSSLTVTDKTDLSGNTTITDGDGTGTRSGKTLTIKMTNEIDNVSARTTTIGTEVLTVTGTTTETHNGNVVINNKSNVNETTDGTVTEKIKTNNYRDVDGNYSGTTGGTTTEVKTKAVSETNLDTTSIVRYSAVTETDKADRTLNVSGNSTTNVRTNVIENTTGTTTIDRHNDVSVNNRTNVTEITSGNSNVTISGTSKVQVSGATTADTGGDVTVKTSGTTSIDRQGGVSANNQSDVTEVTSGNSDVTISGTSKVKVSGSTTADTGGNVTVTTSGTTTETKKGAVNETNLNDKTETTVGNNYENVSGRTVINHSGTTNYNYTGGTTLSGSTLASTTTGNTSLNVSGNTSVNTSGDTTVITTGNTAIHSDGAIGITAVGDIVAESSESDIYITANDDISETAGDIAAFKGVNKTNIGINTEGEEESVETNVYGVNVNIKANKNSDSEVSVVGRAISNSAYTSTTIADYVDITGSTEVNIDGGTINTNASTSVTNYDSAYTSASTATTIIGTADTQVTSAKTVISTANTSATTATLSGDTLTVYEKTSLTYSGGTLTSTTTGNTDIKVSGQTKIDSISAVTIQATHETAGDVNIYAKDALTESGKTISAKSTADTNITVGGKTKIDSISAITIQATDATDGDVNIYAKDALTESGKTVDIIGTNSAATKVTATDAKINIEATGSSANVNITGQTTNISGGTGGVVIKGSKLSAETTGDINLKATGDDGDIYIYAKDELKESGNTVDITATTSVTTKAGTATTSASTVNITGAATVNLTGQTINVDAKTATTEVTSAYTSASTATTIIGTADTKITSGSVSGNTLEIKEASGLTYSGGTLSSTTTGNTDIKVGGKTKIDSTSAITIQATDTNDGDINIYAKDALTESGKTVEIIGTDSTTIKTTGNGSDIFIYAKDKVDISGTSVNITGDTTIDDELTVKSGITVSTGGTDVTGDSTFQDKLTVNSGLTVSSGGVKITKGGLTVTAGGADIKAGGLTVSGDSTFKDKVTINSGLTVSSGGVKITKGGLTVTAGGADIKAGGLTVSGDSTFKNDVSVSGTLTAKTISGVTTLSASTISAGTLYLSSGLGGELSWSYGDTSDKEGGKYNGSASSAITIPSSLSHISSSHTHSYAGSSSAGGAATSANKLNTDAGSGTQPVYFSDGVPVACTYSLNKTVPSDAVFTDHYAWSDITGKPSSYTPSTHTHSISDVTNLQTTLDGKSDTSHTHSIYVKKSGDTMTGDLTVQGSIYQTSDRRLKENISDIDYAKMANANMLKIKKYNFKDDEDKKFVYGVIAQEAEALQLNDVVITDKDGMKAVDYTSVSLLKIAYLEHEVRRLRQIIEKLISDKQ